MVVLRRYTVFYGIVFSGTVCAVICLDGITGVVSVLTGFEA
jgi:hypothetical protein